MIVNGENEKQSLPTVGEVFVKWAEDFWGLKNLPQQPSSTGEAFDYGFMRKLFVDKINNTIKERMGHD